MPVELSPENERFIAQELAKGTYRDRVEVLDAGIELLKQRNQFLEQVDEGRRQLDCSEFVEYDDESLGDAFPS